MHKEQKIYKITLWLKRLCICGKMKFSSKGLQMVIYSLSMISFVNMLSSAPGIIWSSVLCVLTECFCLQLNINTVNVICVGRSIMCTASVWTGTMNTSGNTVDLSRYPALTSTSQLQLWAGTGSCRKSDYFCISAVHADAERGGEAVVRSAQLHVGIWCVQTDHPGGGTVAPVLQPTEDVEAAAVQLANACIHKHAHTHTCAHVFIS